MQWIVTNCKKLLIICSIWYWFVVQNFKHLLQYSFPSLIKEDYEYAITGNVVTTYYHFSSTPLIQIISERPFFLLFVWYNHLNNHILFRNQPTWLNTKFYTSRFNSNSNTSVFFCAVCVFLFSFSIYDSQFRMLYM